MNNLSSGYVSGLVKGILNMDSEIESKLKVAVDHLNHFSAKLLTLALRMQRIRRLENILYRKHSFVGRKKSGICSRYHYTGYVLREKHNSFGFQGFKSDYDFTSDLFRLPKLRPQSLKWAGSSNVY